MKPRLKPFGSKMYMRNRGPRALLLAPAGVAKPAGGVVQVATGCAFPVVGVAVHPLAVALVAIAVVPARGAPEIAGCSGCQTAAGQAAGVGGGNSRSSSSSRSRSRSGLSS